MPWPDSVDTAELLAGIEAKFRRYVVVPDSIAVATALWVAFTYLVEIAVYAPKLLFQFPEREAGKSTALHVIRWMVQRPYLAVEATGAAVYRIVDRLKPTLILDEADTLFERSTVLAHILNSSCDNSGAKIPRVGPRGEVVEFDVYGTQAISMKGLNMPGTTLSRCIICMIWPKLPSEVVDDFNKRDDEEFVTLRRKLLRWSVDNAVTLQAATPEGQFNNRIRNNWQSLWAIADLAGGEWPKRARAAALELETERDEPSEGLRLLAAIRDIFGTREAMTSADICAALVVDPSGEWANFRDKGPISQTQLAVLLKDYRIRTEKVSPAGIRLNGYFCAQFKNAFARLLQKPAREPDIRTESVAKPLRLGRNRGRARRECPVVRLLRRNRERRRIRSWSSAKPIGRQPWSSVRAWKDGKSSASSLTKGTSGCTTTTVFRQPCDAGLPRALSIFVRHAWTKRPRGQPTNAKKARSPLPLIFA